MIQLIAKHTHPVGARFITGESLSSDHFVASDLTPTTPGERLTSPLSCIASAFGNFRTATPDAAFHGIAQANQALERLDRDVACSFAYITHIEQWGEIGLVGSLRAATFSPEGHPTWISDLSLVPRQPVPARTPALCSPYQRVWAAEAKRTASSDPLDGTPATPKGMHSKYIYLTHGTSVVVATAGIARLLVDPELPSMINGSVADLDLWVRGKVGSSAIDHPDNEGLHVLTAVEMALAS